MGQIVNEKKRTQFLLTGNIKEFFRWSIKNLYEKSMKFQFIFILFSCHFISFEMSFFRRLSYWAKPRITLHWHTFLPNTHDTCMYVRWVAWLRCTIITFFDNSGQFHFFPIPTFFVGMHFWLSTRFWLRRFALNFHESDSIFCCGHCWCLHQSRP